MIGIKDLRFKVLIEIEIGIYKRVDDFLKEARI
jgi:hypothetical protein